MNFKNTVKNSSEEILQADSSPMIQRLCEDSANGPKFSPGL